MELPTDPNVHLILCDAARNRPDGKVDIAGYFPIPEVKLDGNTPFPVAINMTFLYVVKDGEGQLRGGFRLLDPLGGELHRQDIEFSKPAGIRHLIILAIGRIPVVHAGNFSLVLELGGQEYRRSVRIFQ